MKWFDKLTFYFISCGLSLRLAILRKNFQLPIKYNKEQDPFVSEVKNENMR